MKKVFVYFILIIFFLFNSIAQETLPEPLNQAPPDFLFILGPRIGINYFNVSEEDFTEEVNEVFPDSGEYFPVTSIFGISMEQRILLGETSSHFVFQELVILSGIEQSIVLPSFSFLIGFRASSGFEFGSGPTFTANGISVLVAAGWTFTFSGVYVPVDLSVVLPNKKRPMSIAFTTGFNFLIKSRNND